MPSFPRAQHADRPRPLRELLRSRSRIGTAACLALTVTMMGLSAIALSVFGPQFRLANAELGAIQDGHVAMINQETGLRGYLVTRDRQFLEPYTQGAADLQELDRQLVDWSADDPELATQVARLQQAEQDWINGWALPLLDSQPDRADGPRLAALLLEGKRLFDAYRVVQSEVRADVERRRDLVSEQQQNALLAVAVVDLVVLALVIGTVKRANRRLVEEIVPPTQQVRDALSALTAGDLARRAPETGSTELRRIAGDVNELAAALEGRNALVEVRERDLVAARDDAERAGQAKTAFLATMSHEIRTPLNAVLGLTDLLLTTPLTDPQRGHLQTIATSGDSLLALINDVLDFSKIEAGELDLERAPFDLHELVYSVGQLFAPQAGRAGLDLLVDVAEDCPAEVVGDCFRLRQVLQNLVANAIKFTAEGFVLLRVSGELVQGRLRARIAVSDTGIGIPADKLDRLFRSFSQVDASTTRSYGGTGLGLAISQRIARAMGGDITVDSELAVGTTFAVTVDLAVPAVLRSAAASTDLAGRRLLLVDDNPTNLEILENQLTRSGAECVLARGGAGALELLIGGEVFDAVLMDLHMPGMDGVELAQQVRALDRGGDLPLLLLSSSSTIEHPGGGSPFAVQLHKPVQPQRLVRAVVSALAVEPEAPVTSSGPGAVPGAARLRVLVAEDHDVNAQLMALYLEQLGHDSVRVENGRAAVDAVRDGDWDVVLMDAQMPVLGGIDATAEIRALPGRQPVVVAVTASVLAGDRNAFLAAGADAFLTKPVRLTVLAETLSRWAGSSPGTVHEGTVVPVPVPVPVPAPRTAPDADRSVAPAAPDALEGALDEETIEDLRDLGPEQLGHLYGAYLAGLGAAVEEIRAAAAEPDRAGEDSLDRLAHRLKGSSAALGALRLAGLCQQLESAGAGPGPAPAELVDALTEESGRVAAAVTALLDAVPAEGVTGSPA